MANEKLSQWVSQFVSLLSSSTLSERNKWTKKCISIISHFVDCNAAKLVLTKWFILTPFQLHHGKTQRKSKQTRHNATNVEQYFTLGKHEMIKPFAIDCMLIYSYTLLNGAARSHKCLYGECNFSNYGFINRAFVYDYILFCHFESYTLPHQ